MDSDGAVLDPRPEWIQVSDAGVPEVNGLYKRAAGWTVPEGDNVRHATVPEAPVQDAAIDTDQMQLLMKGDLMKVDLVALGINMNPHWLELMRWENGKYTLLLEPWGLPMKGIQTTQKQRFAIFSDVNGVTGYMPYYEAFPAKKTAKDSAAHSNKMWEWSLGPAGVDPPPRVKPFLWQGGFLPP